MLAAIAGTAGLIHGLSAGISASTANLSVSVTVAKNCRINTAGSVTVSCTKGAVYAIDFPRQGVPSRGGADAVIVAVDF